MESVSVVALRLPNIEWRAAVMSQVRLSLMIPMSPAGCRVFAREMFLGGREGEGFSWRHSEELDTHIFEIPYRP